MGDFDSIIFVEFDDEGLVLIQTQKNPKKLVYATTVQSLFVCLFSKYSPIKFNPFPVKERR